MKYNFKFKVRATVPGIIQSLPSQFKRNKIRGDIKKKKSCGLLKSLINPFDNTLFYYKNIMLEALYI